MVAAHHRFNRFQVLGYFIITLVLAAAIALGVSYLFLRPQPLKLAVGPAGGLYQRFADKLAHVVQRESRSLRIMPIVTDGDADSLSLLHRGAVDMALARTDAKIPADARSLALIEREMLYVITLKTRKFPSLSNLRGLKVAIPGADGQNEVFIKRLLSAVDVTTSSYSSQTVPIDTPFERLLLGASPPYQAVIALTPSSRFGGTPQREQIGRRFSQFELHGVEGGGAIEKQMPGVFSETIDAGTFSASPAWPDDDVDSVGLHDLLLARRQMTKDRATELTRIIVENKDEMGFDHEFATQIEPPDEEKTAQILAHPGSADYVNGEAKTFLERYSDLFYIGTAAAGLVGSIFVGVYSWITKIDPVRASSLAGEVGRVGERIRKVATHGELDMAETELEEVLKRALTGLEDETISSEGLDVFRLSYDDAHRALLSRRRILLAAERVSSTTSKG